jgi:hypothetical protein
MRPAKIGWEEFCKSFLTVKKDEGQSSAVTDFTRRYDVIAARTARGLVRTVERDEKEYWIVNPKELRLEVESALPGKAKEDSSFGIEPVGIAATTWSSRLVVDLLDEHGNRADIFAMEPICKKIPSALWSKTASLASQPDANAALIEAQVGWSLHPAQAPKPAATGNVRDDAFQFNTLPNQNYRRGPRGRFQHPPDGGAPWNAATLNSAGRAAVLISLGFEPTDSHLSDTLADALTAAPQVITA